MEISKQLILNVSFSNDGETQETEIFALFLSEPFIFNLDPIKHAWYFQFQIDHLNDATFIRKVSDLLIWILWCINMLSASHFVSFVLTFRKLF